MEKEPKSSHGDKVVDLVTWRRAKIAEEEIRDMSQEQISGELNRLGVDTEPLRKNVKMMLDSYFSKRKNTEDDENSIQGK